MMMNREGEREDFTTKIRDFMLDLRNYALSQQHENWLLSCVRWNGCEKGTGEKVSLTNYLS